MARKDAKLPSSNPQVALQQALNIHGLATFPNVYSQVDVGSMNIASNCVIDAPGVIQSRRGFKQYATYATGTPLQTLTIGEYQNTLVTHCSNGTIYKDDGAGTFTSLPGTFYPPELEPASRVSFISLNKNLYFTSDRGIYKIDDLNAAPKQAGLNISPIGRGTVSGSSGWFTNNTNVAYRIIFLYTDANNNIIRGPVSDRAIIQNTAGGTRNATVTFILPEGTESGFTYQLYRSNLSANVSAEPDDNMQLVFEDTVTPTDITNNSVTITDETPDVLKGLVLYTSAEGITSSNEAPPFAKAMALYKDTVCYGNVTSPATLFVSLIGSITLGDTFTFTSDVGVFTLTASAAENPLTGEFQTFTGGTPGENVSKTTESLCYIANIYTANTFLDVLSISNFDEAPGKIAFRSDVDFYINSTAVNTIPALPAAGQSQSNTASVLREENVIYFSKPGLPEAVPTVQFMAIGTNSTRIVKLIALRDSIVVFKSDGIYRITGNSFSTFSLTPIDLKIRILAPNSVTALNNVVYAFSDQGVIRVQESGGIELISLPIEGILLETAALPGFEDATYGVAYPSEHKFIMYTISTEFDVTASKAFVYNYITDSWTTWATSFSAAYVAQNNKLYQATFNILGSMMYEERKNFNSSDYADDEYACTITAVSGAQITISGFAAIPGQTITQVTSGGTLQAIVVDVVGAVATVSNILPWELAGATLFNPIGVLFNMNQFVGDSPNVMKQFPEVSLLLDADSFRSLGISFETDQGAAGTLGQDFDFSVSGEWGGFNWGGQAWGSLSREYQRVRLYVPRNAQKGNWIKMGVGLRQCFKKMRCAGITVAFRTLTVRQR